MWDSNLRIVLDPLCSLTSIITKSCQFYLLYFPHFSGHFCSTKHGLYSPSDPVTHVFEFYYTSQWVTLDKVKFCLRILIYSKLKILTTLYRWWKLNEIVFKMCSVITQSRVNKIWQPVSLSSSPGLRSLPWHTTATSFVGWLDPSSPASQSAPLQGHQVSSVPTAYPPPFPLSFRLAYS